MTPKSALEFLAGAVYGAGNPFTEIGSPVTGDLLETTSSYSEAIQKRDHKFCKVPRLSSLPSWEMGELTEGAKS